MTNIAYVQGDATQPQGTGARIIVHICNDIGGWGAGFVLVHSGLNSLAAGSAPQCLYAAMRPQSQARANRQAMCAKLY